MRAKKQDVWFFLTVLAAGVIIGFASIALVSQFLPAKSLLKAQQAQVKQAQQAQTQQVQASATGTDEQAMGTVSDEPPVIHLATSTVDAAWIKPIELSKKEIKELFLTVTTDTALVDNFLHDPITRSSDGSAASDVKWWSSPPVEEIVLHMWHVGTITSDNYKGDDVFLIKKSATEGPDWPYYDMVVYDSTARHFYFPRQPGELTWYADTRQLERLYEPRGIYFPSLDMPNKFMLTNGKFLYGDGQATTIDRDKGTWMETSDKMIFMGKTSDGRSFYELKGDDTRGCIFVFDAAGRVYTYSSSISSDIQWNRPVNKQENYEAFLNTGCGTSPCIDIINPPSSSTIEVAGRTDDGDPVYVLKDYENDASAKQLYDTWLSMRNEKKTIQEMLKEHPIPFYYWQDAFGRWVSYQNTAIVPQAECGKPVIYLYPEKKTDVSVKIPNFINVTKSDPTYPSNGWTVTANPNGDIVSHADGKTYGSLFWEGTGVNYQVPTTGFVVKGGEVEVFLERTLAKYGLNQKEASEFMDFWVPKLKGAPYYQFSFLTDEWSKAAPLSVSPRPQTSIRIFMDWKPLSAPVSIKAPTIVTPKRDGFTLVEWGGTLYK